MWLSKPVYELLPYYYLVAGLVVLVASASFDQALWSTLCVLAGLACLLAGSVIWLKRRDYRRRHRDHGAELDELGF